MLREGWELLSEMKGIAALHPTKGTGVETLSTKWPFLHCSTCFPALAFYCAFYPLPWHSPCLRGHLSPFEMFMSYLSFKPQLNLYPFYKAYFPSPYWAAHFHLWTSISSLFSVWSMNQPHGASCESSWEVQTLRPHPRPTELASAFYQDSHEIAVHTEVRRTPVYSTYCLALPCGCLT